MPAAPAPADGKLDTLSPNGSKGEAAGAGAAAPVGLLGTGVGKAAPPNGDDASPKGSKWVAVAAADRAVLALDMLPPVGPAAAAPPVPGLL
jgi:hypothetical protein